MLLMKTLEAFNQKRPKKKKKICVLKGNQEELKRK